MKKPTVLIFGTFDLLHPGHLSFIRQASRFGSVHAVVARDKTVKKLKGFWPKDTERTRLAKVSLVAEVRRAILGDHNLDHKYDVLKKIRPDIICLGYDQTYFTKKLPAVLRQSGLAIKIIRLKAHKPNLYKSSIAKRQLSSN